VAPDGVTTASVISHSGLRTTIPVERNAYEAIIADPVAVRFVGLRDRQAVTRVIPLTTFSTRSASPQSSGAGG
jgi:hypothetical protein